MTAPYGLHAPDTTFVPHAVAEKQVDLGEITMNYATAGAADLPPLLLIPGQTESWWGYEATMQILQNNFQVFAVDLRGQGRSSRTPGRYSLNNMGNDLVRFIALVIQRPTYVSGLSSGGVLSAWLSAYAMPGTVLGAIYEDPPLFAAETTPAYGHSIRQAAGPLFAALHKYLGDQWGVDNWPGLVGAAQTELPPWLAGLFTGDSPPQNFKEYDPEWGKAFWTGTVGINCDHKRMLESVKVPVLLTHHFRTVDEATNTLMGALSDMQAGKVGDIVRATGQPFSYSSFPQMGHSMHGEDPALFAETVTEWAGHTGRALGA